VREALFMALEPLHGLRVVDLFAGSGALGIEALSRGARQADFVEWRRPSRMALESNLATLELSDRARVWAYHLPEGLKRMDAILEAADIVLLDPPYGGREARATLAALGEGGTLTAGARVVVEHHAKDDLPQRAGRLERIRQRRYGETEVTTYEAGASDAPPRAEGNEP